MNELIDTHAHLNSPRFYKRVDEILKRSEEVGVGRILVVGYDLKNSQEAVQLAKQYPNLYAAVGLHPSDVHDGKGFNLEDYKKILSPENKVIAIGEVGLDYYRSPKNKKEQIIALEAFLNLSKEVKLPLILHIRDAYKDAFMVLEQEKDLPDLIFHCFSGNVNEAKRALDLGGYISFAGNITYPKAQGLRDALRFIPMDKLLLETDAPYLSPQSKRGTLCEPAFIVETYDIAAQIKSVSRRELSRRINLNWNKLTGDGNAGKSN